MKQKKLLLVDDNDKYAKILTEYFSKHSFFVDRAYDGKEGLQKLKDNGTEYYQVILTDITMESQLAGISFLKKARQMGFKGKILIASTGFNYSIALLLAPIFLNNLKVDYLIPKTSVLKKDIEFYPCKIFSRSQKELFI